MQGARQRVRRARFRQVTVKRKVNIVSCGGRHSTAAEIFRSLSCSFTQERGSERKGADTTGVSEIRTRLVFRPVLTRKMPAVFPPRSMTIVFFTIYRDIEPDGFCRV